jgi:hypothetical protein
MNRIKIIFLFFLILISQSCKDNPVSDTPTEKKGSISGFVKDSTYSTKLSQVTVKLNSTNFSALTDSNGYFLIKDVPYNKYSVSFQTPGYNVKQTEVILNDSSINLGLVSLSRRKYPFDIIPFSQLPNLLNADSTYYKLSSTEFFRNQIQKHTHNTPDWDSVFVNNFIDSILIDIRILNIEIDTVWYQSYLPQCGSTTEAFLPKIVVKLKKQDSRMYLLNFESPLPFPGAYFVIWNQCQSSSMHYRKYYKFD